MHRSFLPLAAATHCFLVALPIPVCGETVPPGVDWRTSDPLLYGHVVIECTVSELANKEVTLDQLGIGDLPGVTTILKEARVVDLKVLRGVYSGRAILIDMNALEGIAAEKLIGKRVVLCGRWKPHLGEFVVASSRSILAWSDSGWRRLYDGQVLPQTELNRIIDSAQPNAVLKQATVVVSGRITSREEAQVEFASGRSSKVWRVTLEVEGVLKGEATSPHVSFVVIRDEYTPPWRGQAPSKLLPGETWIAFLAEYEGFLAPVLGKNGLLMVDGERLVYDRTVSYPLSRSALERMVREEANEH